MEIKQINRIEGESLDDEAYLKLLAEEKKASVKMDAFYARGLKQSAEEQKALDVKRKKALAKYPELEGLI